MSAVHIGFPLRLDARGRTATVDDDGHIRDMIEQLLFTSPGERVNRPDFGSGLRQLVFAPAGDELATALQFTIQAALQRWLGDLIELLAVDVTGGEAEIRIVVRYLVRRTDQARTAEFTTDL